MRDNKKTIANDVFAEVREEIADGQQEILEIKRVVHDQTTKQFSIKIPKKLAGKSKLNENSEFEIVFNPKEETKERLNKSKLIIFLKEVNYGTKNNIKL